MYYLPSTVFDGLDGLDDQCTTSGPVQLISNGYQFYEAPLLSTPPMKYDPTLHSAVDVEMNPAPSLSKEKNLVFTLLHLPAPLTPGPGAGTEPVIYLNVALPPLSTGTGTANARVTAPQTVLSDNTARAQIEAYIHTARWFQLDILEARVGDSCVPVSALQLAQRGQSIWACFVNRVRRKGRRIFKCTTCRHETDRLHRAVSHQRAKWGHKPFACTDLGCSFRGSTQESLSDHCSARTGTAPCKLCGEERMIKNMERHLKICTSSK